MLYFLYVSVNLVRVLLGFFQLVLCISAILSWFPVFDEGNVFIDLIDRICEPILFPARLLVDRSSFLSSLPIDVSYIITYIALSVIGALLPVIVL